MGLNSGPIGTYKRTFFFLQSMSWYRREVIVVMYNLLFANFWSGVGSFSS